VVRLSGGIVRDLTFKSKNFTKFLIFKDGEIVSRFEPKVKPESKEMVEAVEAELKK
jgi:glutathione peroxidase-family protein